jgi:hypothetical protein|nr:MAG TPA: hypothetical protein [Bacteriophage sp.]
MGMLNRKLSMCLHKPREDVRHFDNGLKNIYKPLS